MVILLFFFGLDLIGLIELFWAGYFTIKIEVIGRIFLWGEVKYNVFMGVEW